jgi:hypothetical protein
MIPALAAQAAVRGDHNQQEPRPFSGSEYRIICCQSGHFRRANDPHQCSQALYIGAGIFSKGAHPVELYRGNHLHSAGYLLG